MAKKIYQLQSNNKFHEFALVSYFSNFKGEPCAILEREDGTLTAGPIKYLRTKLPDNGTVVPQGTASTSKGPVTTVGDATIRSSLLTGEQVTKAPNSPQAKPNLGRETVSEPSNEVPTGEIPLPNIQILNKDVDLNEPK